MNSFFNVATVYFDKALNGNKNRLQSSLHKSVLSFIPWIFPILRTSLSFSLQLQFSSVQLLSHVQLYATQGLQHARIPCPVTNSQSLLKLMSIESVIPSNHLILCLPFSSCLQSFTASGSFPMSQFFTSGGQSIGVSVSASVLPMNIQDWFPLGWTGWISLQSKGLSRVFSSTIVQKHQFFSAQLSL